MSENQPKPKAEKAQVFIWKARHRGFLAVVAKNLKDARALVEIDHPAWVQRASREPDAVLKPESGQSVYVKQRVV